MVALWQTLRTRHHCGRGLLVLILTLLFLSLLAGAILTPESRSGAVDLGKPGLCGGAGSGQ